MVLGDAVFPDPGSEWARSLLWGGRNGGHPVLECEGAGDNFLLCLLIQCICCLLNNHFILQTSFQMHLATLGS